MMIDGPWLVDPKAHSSDGPQVEYGVAPFPPPAAHPERANTAVIQGPVVILPAGAVDKEAAVQLLAWMTGCPPSTEREGFEVALARVQPSRDRMIPEPCFDFDASLTATPVR